VALRKSNRVTVATGPTLKVTALLEHEMAMIDVSLDGASRAEHQMSGVDGANHLAQDYGVLGDDVSFNGTMFGQVELPAADLAFNPA